MLNLEWPCRVDRGDSPEGRNILITGGAGFLGSHLADRLISRGDRVFCLDNFYTGRSENLADLKARSRLTIVRHDIVDGIPQALPVFAEIYNLACAASPIHYQADPTRTALVNSIGVLNVLRRAEQDGARIFQASTSEIYGDPQVHPQREDYWGNVNSVGPRSCYDEGKRFAETLCTDFARSRGLTLRMARIFNTYGPRMRRDDGRVVSNLIVQALMGEPLTLYGEGLQTRSFCFVDDLIGGIDHLMQSPLAEGPVNLGNPVEVTVKELAERVLEMTGSSAPIVYLPLPADDPKRRQPDIGKASRLLNWRPETGLRDGLARTIAYFRGEIARTANAVSAAE